MRRPLREPDPSHTWLAANVELGEILARLGTGLALETAEEYVGSFSRIVPFTDRQGAKKILKVRARWMTEGRVAFEHALAKHLADAGLPMPVPIPFEGGGTWQKAGGFFCEVRPFVEGREARPVAGEVYLMGLLLGAFHRHSREFDASGYEPPEVQNQVEPQELESELEILRQLEANPGLAGPGYFDTLWTRWEETKAYLAERAASLPQLVRHGDFHEWNVLFSNQEPTRVAALLDLDMAAIGPRIYDVSYAVLMFRLLFLGGSVENWGALYRTFLRGYAEASHAQIEGSEVEALPYLIECLAIQFLVRRLKWAYTTDRVNEEYRQEYLEVVDWLDRFKGELAEMLRKAGGRRHHGRSFR